MSNIEPKGSSKRNSGWLVMMVDGKKRLGLNEREIRAAENRKRLALMEDLKFKRRHTKRESKPPRSSWPIVERDQGIAYNKMHLSLIHEVKMTGRLKKRVEKMERSNSATRQLLRGSTPSPKKDIKSTNPAEFVSLKGEDKPSKVDDVKSERHVFSQTSLLNEVGGCPAILDQGKSEIQEEVKLEEATSLGYNKPKEVKSKPNLRCRASDQREEEERPPVIIRDNSLEPYDVNLDEATSLGKKQKGNRPKALSNRSLPRWNSEKKRPKALSNGSLPRKNSEKNLVTLKEVETKRMSYRTQVFMDWKKKARSSKKRNSAPTSASRKKLTGLDPDVIAQTQREIAEFAERESDSLGLMLIKELTGIHVEGESKPTSGWLEDVECSTAVGGLY